MVEFQAAVRHVSKVDERSMALQVRVVIETGITSVGQRLRVRLEGFSLRQKMTLDIIYIEDGGGAVVVGNFLSRGDVEIVLQRPVLVGIKLRSQRAFIDQAVQVGQ